MLQQWLFAEMPRHPDYLIYEGHQEPRGVLPTLLVGLARGIGWGITGAIALSLFAALLYLFRGSAPFEANGSALAGVIQAYFAGGPLAGCCAGPLLKLGRWRIGAAVLGIIAAFCLYLAVTVAQEGWPIRGEHLILAASAGLVAGPVGGILVWNRKYQERQAYYRRLEETQRLLGKRRPPRARPHV